MTEAQAWREIAERIARGVSPAYLCHGVDDIRIARRVGEGLSDRMRKRLADHGISSGMTLWNVAYDGEDGEWTYVIARDLRVTAALFLALEAEDEVRSAQGVRE